MVNSIARTPPACTARATWISSSDRSKRTIATTPPVSMMRTESSLPTSRPSASDPQAFRHRSLEQLLGLLERRPIEIAPRGLFERGKRIPKTHALVDSLGDVSVNEACRVVVPPAQPVHNLNLIRYILDVPALGVGEGAPRVAPHRRRSPQGDRDDLEAEAPRQFLGDFLVVGALDAEYPLRIF